MPLNYLEFFSAICHQNINRIKLGSEPKKKTVQINKIMAVNRTRSKQKRVELGRRMVAAAATRNNLRFLGHFVIYFSRP